jgi:DNA-binding NtrC family response regulator
VVPIDIPPLREHKEDIPDLVKHFIARFGADNERDIRGITAAALNMLIDYHWPGNVRQLENTIERAVALSRGTSGMIEVEDVHLDTAKSKTEVSSGIAFLPEGVTLEQWEDEMIREALRRANGNKSQAARLLGLSRNALRYRLGKLGMPDEEV